MFLNIFSFSVKDKQAVLGVNHQGPGIISAAFNFIWHKSSAETLIENYISNTPLTKEMSISTGNNFRISPKEELQ